MSIPGKIIVFNYATERLAKQRWTQSFVWNSESTHKSAWLKRGWIYQENLVEHVINLDWGVMQKVCHCQNWSNRVDLACECVEGIKACNFRFAFMSTAVQPCFIGLPFFMGPSLSKKKFHKALFLQQCSVVPGLEKIRDLIGPAKMTNFKTFFLDETFLCLLWDVECLLHAWHSE